MRIGLISLGCPKNQVDAEMILAALQEDGFEIVDYVDGADAVIINTCAFIDDAKREAIENILDMAELKKEGVIRKIIVTGCLVQTEKDAILSEFPEVDAVIGIGANGSVVELVKKVLTEDTRLFECPDQREMSMDGQRALTTPEYWAYLKIADGCSNCCTYCAIPGIRGGFRSRSMENILEEAKQLAETGVRELILIAQDTTNYGADLYGEKKLPELLHKLCEIDGIEWIRLLYCYPDKVTDELIETMASEPKVLHYMDLPLQHADDRILKAMNRKGTVAEIRALIEKLRTAMPDIVIRTTFMTGFPGEDEDAFDNLALFVNEMEFDRMGCFSFSPQAGTPAYDMDGQVEDDVKQRRGEILMNDQYSIVEDKNLARIGKTYTVLVEEYDAYSDCYIGRTYMDAPEIDGVLYFTSGKEYEPGDFAQVIVTDTKEYDLVGRDTASV
ncbi:MAG: 30S ribosomal protein S12 methylthiotransferase RimO [Oscillospiraceae bacterium]|nr:30S ribosomal protein S12 methylthiotransferase RimO [Oscillospiraceae bacterium]